MIYYIVRIFEINDDSMKEYEYTNIESAMKVFQNEPIAQLIKITDNHCEYLGENKILKGNYDESQITN